MLSPNSLSNVYLVNKARILLLVLLYMKKIDNSTENI